MVIKLLILPNLFFFRIREILNNEKFPTENTDLYPGDYLIRYCKKDY